MPAATQIRADSVARQAVLTAASPLKLFTAQSQSADSAAQTSAAFSSFEDALNAAQRPDPNAQSSQAASTTAPTTPDAQSTGEQESDEEEDNSDTQAQDASQAQRANNHTNKKIRTHKTQTSSNTTTSTGPETDPATATPGASTNPAAADPTSKSEKKPPTAQNVNPAAPPNSITVDAAALAAQQLAANTPAPITPAAAKKLPVTTTDESATPTKAQPATQTPSPLASHAPPIAAKQDPEKSPLVAETFAVKDQKKQLVQDNTDPQTNSAPSAPHTPQLQSANKPTLQPNNAKDGPADNSVPAAQSNPTPQPLTPTLDPLAQSIADSTPATAAQPPLQPDQGTPKPGTPNIITGGISTPALSTQDSADAAPAAQSPPENDPEQTFQQVIAGLRGKMDPTSGKAEISLNPPNLGALHVSISLSNGSLTAQFQSSSDVVRDLLKTNMEKLKTVLQGQGIAVDKLAVEAPAGKVVAETTKTSNPNSPNNDGRSAGQYTRDQSHPKRSSGSQAFAKLWQGTGAPVEETPIDVVG